MTTMVGCFLLQRDQDIVSRRILEVLDMGSREKSPFIPQLLEVRKAFRHA